MWEADISYVQLARKFMNLVAVMDRYSHHALSWGVSNTLYTDFCVGVLEETLARHEPPEIFNTDQGCQLTSQVFTSVLEDHGVAISLDGKGCCLNNLFVE